MQKRTFQVNDVLRGIPSSEIYWQLFEYAKSKGVPVYSGCGKEDYGGWPNICFSVKRNLVSNCSDENSQNINWITFEQFFEYCDNWTASHPLRVNLNEEYTAEIVDGKIKVGSQRFEFSAIEELYNAIKKFKTE